jgi:tight adherence protein C
MTELFTQTNPVLIASVVGTLILFGLFYLVTQYLGENRARAEVKKRLSAKPHSLSPVEPSAREKISETESNDKKLKNRVAKKANDFYSTSDPDSVKKLRLMLIQAGYVNPQALGYFIASRFIAAGAGLAIGILLVITSFQEESVGYKSGIIIALLAIGYFLPNFYLSRKTAAVEQMNRQGFPDILDLMVVSAEAGLTMEASIERITNEIKDIYPNLALQLHMASLEIRAGRPIDQALRAFGERLRLEEVKGFATMVQQAKELGTSVADALRVYSDEMRHKRMMKAEEKAYALPAKMSIPVTVFILPIVIGIAVIPTIVRWNI